MKYLGEPSSERGGLEQAVAEAVIKAYKQHDGDLLVFLPGVGEIKGCVAPGPRRSVCASARCLSPPDMTTV